VGQTRQGTAQAVEVQASQAVVEQARPEAAKAAVGQTRDVTKEQHKLLEYRHVQWHHSLR
jgi:hypothetical protein